MTPTPAPAIAGAPQPLVSRVGRYLVIHEESFASVGLSSNVYITEQDGRYYVFDASGHPALLSFIEATGIHCGYIAGIFLTHGHYDHVMGLKSLAGLDLPVFISQKDAALMESNAGKVRAKGFESPEGASMLESLSLRAIATPGHSPGSTCFYSQQEGLLISGDTVFPEGYFGRTDLAGGSDAEMLASLEKLSKLDVDIMLPGHDMPVPERASESIKSSQACAKAMLKP